jgi:hypothetical protein
VARPPECVVLRIWRETLLTIGLQPRYLSVLFVRAYRLKLNSMMASWLQ